MDLGLERAGFVCKWQVEIDASCRAVLATHWPDVERFEDVREVGRAQLAPVDLIAGGFPCTDLSLAGGRAGLAGRESRLWWEQRRIIAELAPRWVLIENVDALLSSHEGADLAALLGSLGELGYGWAYRVLDAQAFGVPQRRRRIFIVGHRGEPWSAPAAVLFEPESVRRHPAESGATWPEVAAGAGDGVAGGGRERERE